MELPMQRTHHVIRFWNGQRLDLAIREGELYELQPDDPDKSGQCGRVCRVEAVENAPVPRRARVRFEDNGRIGLVELQDLLEIEAASA